jgi:hypothetical protein
MVMWLHVTAFSTFPFRRTGEGNFYQQQHHQHRRFFYHGKHFYSAATGTQGRSFSALLDPTSRDTLDVLFLLFSLFFRFLLHFAFAFASFSLFLSLSASFRSRSSFQLGNALLLFATRRCYETQNNEQQTHKQRQKYITHKNCREDSMQVSCCFYLQTNSLSLSLSLSLHLRVVFLLHKNKCVVHNKQYEKRR